MGELTASQWHGCYDAPWKEIVKAAFAHPAKISKALADRIYAHAVERGWIGPGGLVLDPFGGIGGTALWPALNGVRWVGVELEPRFVELAQANFALWKSRWSHIPEWVEPVIVQGDSRRLGALLSGEPPSLLVSSPPYSAGTVHSGCGIDLEKLTGNEPGPNTQAKAQGYGATVGQLGALPVGVAPDLVCSSPPYEGSDLNGRRATPCLEHKAELLEKAGYDAKGWLGKARCTQMRNDGYIGSPGQIGETTGDTFWAAARTILEQTYAVLKPGGHAIWVCKRFVRKGKIVEFPQQWAALCESVGFNLVCWHHAMLVKHGGTQKLLDGGEEELSKSRKSFFRRLAEKKGSPAIDWEDVICMEK